MGARLAPPRWILDTNVVLSALIRPGGSTGRLRLGWQSGLFVPVVATATVAELLRVLAYPKFRLAPDEHFDLLADYLPWTEVAAISQPPPPTPPCRDPDDLKFLQLALAARADALVTGDADLLALAEFVPVRVMSVNAALELLER
jgi:putative PIN family toxin of toxin-antitoxin system